MASVAVFALAWGWWAYPLPDGSEAALPIVYLDAQGREIATFHGLNGRYQIWLPLDQMPPVVVGAVIAAEDRRFRNHLGVDLFAVSRAAVHNARGGEVVRGASTITQQLARGLFLTRERTWTRKVREVAIALLLEMRYSKERILETYLNTVYLGQERDAAVLGVAAGARHLLGKDISALRLDEAALLAAAIRAPNRVYSDDPTLVRGRRDRVLDAMVAQGVATEPDAKLAMARPLRPPTAPPSRAPWFIELAREETARRLVGGVPGGRLTTSLDRSLQEIAEAAVRDQLARAERSRKGLPAGTLQAAVIAMEPGTGRVRTLVGGRHYTTSEFNHAVKARRQPGSLFKPLVYLAAFESRGDRLTAASVVSDEPIVIPAVGGGWSPHNIDGQFRGPVTIRRALEDSLNVPAALVGQEVGMRQVVQVAGAMGIESRLAAVPSLALGTSEVTLLEMTTAFATLANGGLRVRPTTLDDAGPQATLREQPRPDRAVSAESAFIVTHMLRGVMRRGTGGSSARWGLQEVTAGKTGTTDGLRDAWFIGYTPDLVVGVWVGADDGRSIGLTGSDIALPIWATVMQAAVRRAPPRPFTTPPGIVMASVESGTGRRACGSDEAINEAFRQGSEPPPCERELFADAPVVKDIFQWFRGIFR
ncbi:MAG TPA: transglycosylase domain-containing protein [Pseudomonadales bacterium]|nr:transglycosylase domain-containing protein [Pseudomonadales bacterium]